MVAAKIDLITMFRNVDEELEVFTAAQPTNEGYIADGWVSAGSKKVLSITGSHSLVFDEIVASDESAISITARSEWVPHVDFQNICELIKQPLDHDNLISILDELVQLAVTLAGKVAGSIDVQTPHLAKYKAWLLQHAGPDRGDSNATSLA